MRFFLLIIPILFFYNCSKPKTVLICGDHICVNKLEAEQYFEENLTIEVKIIDIKKKKQTDLVELNLKENSNQNNQVIVKQKSQTKEVVKILNNNQIEKIKNEIKIKEKNKKNNKKNASIKKVNDDKIFKKKIDIQKKEVKKTTNKKSKPLEKREKIYANKSSNKVVDICTLIEKCSIDEISKYLLKQAGNKEFPDITTRE